MSMTSTGLKAFTTHGEPLHTCPICRRGNFTASGLARHRCAVRPPLVRESAAGTFRCAVCHEMKSDRHANTKVCTGCAKASPISWLAH